MIKNKILGLTLCGLVSIGSILTIVQPKMAYAKETINIGENVSKDNNNKIKNLDEIEKILLNYFKKNNLNYEVGTEEYIDYLMSVLLEDKDKVLAEHPKYDDILFYASEYVANFDNLSISTKEFKNKKVDPLSKIRLKNIDDVKYSIKEQEKNRENEIQQSKESNLITPRAVYNRTAAVNYAKKWAYGRNSQYDTYSKDCTNFVSQAVNAGGMDEKKLSPLPTGIYSTTSYWYSDRFEHVAVGTPYYSWRDSTSWVRVVDFHSYWAKTKQVIIAPVTGTIAYHANVGDVVQFRRKSDGSWYHSSIVTRKDNGTIYLASHTSDYAEKNITDIASHQEYRVIKF